MKHLLFLCSILSLSAFGQLTPGFNADEYNELLLISVRTAADSSYAAKYEEPAHSEMLYQSAPIGLDNQWDLWLDTRPTSTPTAIISVRGTTPNPESWLLNFYAAMIPAQGEIKWTENGEAKTFAYHMADNEKAAVHAGWTLACGMLLDDILPKIDDQYSRGVKNYLIMGHSQGGAISYLLTSQLHHLQEVGELPKDIRFKTYCSAAPKTGNLFYAREFEALTQNGWAFNVINAADWVPEVPISIQTLDDFNPTNPFVHVDDIMEQQSFVNRVGMWWILRKLQNPAEEAQENYEKYLGEKLQERVSSLVTGLEMPEFYPSNHYVRTGIQIVLQPDEEYFEMFPNNPDSVFMHHLHAPYLLLTRKLDTPFYLKNSIIAMQWSLNGYADETGIWQSLSYYNKRPYIIFKTDGKILGYTGDMEEGCLFEISYLLKDDGLTVYRDLNIHGDCPDSHWFIRNLRTCNNVQLIGNELLLLNGEEVLFRFNIGNSH